MAALLKRQSKRKAVRSHLATLMDRGKDLLSEDTLTTSQVNGLKASINKIVDRLQGLDDEISNSLNPDQIEADVLESIQILDPVELLLAELDVKLQHINFSAPPVSVSSSSNSVQCKLPKLELPTFKGNVLEWQGFWDQFNVAIHRNESLSDIDKFNYLKRYLTGSALSSISGLSLSSANYTEAIKLLEERFGNPQVLVSAHMESLLKLGKVYTMDNLKGLRKLYTDIENCVRNLRSLDIETSTYGCLLIPILKERLPDALIVQISRKFSGNVWTLDLLLQHFHDELKASESCLPVLKRVSETEKRYHSEFTASSLFGQTSKYSGSKGNKGCVFCDKEHPSSRCRTVTNIQSRKDILRRDKRCFICLGFGHLARACRANYLCLKCKQGKHHVTICPNIDNHVNNTNRDEKNSTHCQCSHEKSSNPTVNDSITTAFAGNSNSVLLQTARAKVFDTDGLVNVNTRILFDSGSQRSYISEKVRKVLGLKTVRKEKITIKTFGDVNNSAPKVLDVVEFKVKYRDRNKFVLVEALCTENICSPIANQNVTDAKKFAHLADLDFADFEGNSSSLGIGILVGVDFYHSFINGKVIRGSKGPVASESVLGWVLSGSMRNDRLSSSAHCFETHVMRCEVDGCQDLRKELNKFWEVESIEGEKCVVSEFESNIHHNGIRYVSALPFKPDHDSLPDNFETAKTRLRALRKSLIHKDLEKQYDDIFFDYEQQKIIERVPDCEISMDKGEVHYLPHRPVLRMDKDTTKVRAVFDASCSNNGPSLNNCLYPGPNLLSKIFDVLLRFRLNAVGVIADIKQAFLNIEVDKKHTDFLRFLWYNTNDQDNFDIVIYRFLRVVFGVNCSPYILNATIRQHLEKYFPSETALIARLIKEFYVDDLVSGCEDSESGKRFYDKVKEIMSEAGFTLRKWVTNDSELKEYFQTKENDFTNECEKVDSMTYFEEVTCAKDCVKRVLGLEWDVQRDEFVMRFDDFLQKSENVEWTKRNILSVSSSVFDPLGFVSPMTTKLKTIFQLLCKDKLDWDDRIPGNIENVWIKLLESIRLKSVFRISRFCFSKLKDVNLVQLHGFSDSSTESYCAVVYLRFITSSGVGVSFLASKTKVAPLKTLTVPRLELLGCLLLSKLMGEIQSCLTDRIVVDEVFCWSDSQVSLCWIKGKEKSWKPWVENRVVKIRKVVTADKWHFIKGEDNPADIPTRLTVDFDDVFWDRWINGPEFLLSSSNLTLHYDIDSDLTTHDAMKESRTKPDSKFGIDEPHGKECETLCCNYATNLLLNDMGTSVSLSRVIDINRFSSFTRLIRVTGFVFRYINNLRHRIKKKFDAVVSDPVLTLEENERSLKMWLLSEQTTLKLQPNYLKLKNSLNLFEEDDLLRLRGRFQNSTIDFNAKFPILIRGKESSFTRLVIWDAHQKVLHHGVESTLARVRSKFWLVRGRKTVKDIIRKCVVCRRYQGKTMASPPSPDLPSFRVNVNFSFYSIGIDYAGPLNIKDRDCTSKVYVLLFSCATSRALHLEITPDLGKFSFIRAFERFMARKGRPKIVISDNAKTFKAREVKRFFTNLEIQHKFILPASPWWGGFYERMVRTIKTSLRKSLGRSLVTYEQLETLLCKIESIINSRPLTYMSEDDIDEPLTPFLLLFGRNITNVLPSVEEQTGEEPLVKRLKYLKQLLEHFWKRFVTNYLNELRQMNLYRKSKANKQQLLKGDIVLIKDDTPLPRYKWKIGKVEELVTGKDGLTRGAKLRVSSASEKASTWFRPVQKLVPFEIVDDCCEQKENQDNSEENDDSARNEVVASRDRIPRKAAIEGTITRRLREIYS